MDKFPTTGNPLVDWALFAIVCIGAVFLLSIGEQTESVKGKCNEKEDKKS